MAAHHRGTNRESAFYINRTGSISMPEISGLIGIALAFFMISMPALRKIFEVGM
jgi:hypothetical protein